MKLLFCIKGLNNPGGGAERVLVDIANGLTQRGHRVGVLSFDAPGGDSYYRLHSDVERIELGLGITKDPSSFLMTLRRILAMRAAIRSWSPELVVGFMHSMFIPLGLCLASLRIPLIASEHTNYRHYKDLRLQALLLYAVPFLADSITCVSEQVRQTYPSFLRERMTIVPNPVTLSATDKSDVVAHSRRRKMLLSAGRLDAGKDHATLIQAFGRVAVRAPDWDLRIVGEGALRPKLDEQISALGLKDRVTLVGAVEKISNEYQNAQLFVLPSRYESFSLTTAEALAHGLPVIAFSDCPAIVQWIEPGRNGVLVDPAGDRAESLAAALLPLVLDEELRRELANGAELPEDYRLERVLDRWEQVLCSTSRREPDV
jgi:glycosyltransferase involved in cell wall biosynthesis